MGKQTVKTKTLAFHQWGTDKAKLIQLPNGTFEVLIPAMTIPVPASGKYSIEDARARGFTPSQVLLGSLRGTLSSIGTQLK